MSNEKIRSLQKDVCDLPPELPPLKKLCPRCDPDPNYIEPDWTSIPGETYLNKKTCEYQVCVTVNDVGKSMVLGLIDDDPNDNMPPRLPDDPIEQRRILRSYIQPAIRIMLEDQGKLVTDQIICAYHEGPSIASLNPEDLITLLNNNELNSLYELIQADPITDRCRDETDILDMKNYFPEYLPDEPLDSTARMAEIISLLPTIKNPLALELHAYVKEFYIDPFDSMLKVLVALPQHMFDAVPNKPTNQQLEQQAQQLVEEVEIDVAEFYGQIQRLRVALGVYSKYQSYFDQVEKGSLKLFLNDEPYRKEPDYYCITHAVGVNNFRKTLKKFAKANGWNIKSNVGSAVRQNARLIKITFDSSDPENPYMISKIEVKKKGCPYVRIEKKFDFYFKSSVQNASGEQVKVPKFNSTTMGYIAKLKEIDLALRARQSYPWLEFLIKFTFPVIKVDYGSMTEEKIKDSAGDCAASNALQFSLDMKNYILSHSLNIMEILDYEYNQATCSQLGNFEQQPEITEFRKDFKNVGKKVKQQQYEKARSEFEEEGGSTKIVLVGIETEVTWENTTDLANKIEDYKKVLADTEKNFEDDKQKLQEHINNEPKSINWATIEVVASWNKTKKFLEQKIEYYPQSIKDIDNAIRVLERSLGKSNRQIDRQIRKARGKAEKQAVRSARNDNHPYIRKARAAALQELQSQNSILTSIIDMESWSENGMRGIKFNDFNDKIELETVKERMTYCNIKSLTVQGVRCLMSGVTQEAALRKIIRVALEEMDIDVIGIFIQNLPPQSQVELRQKFEEEFGSLPLPWEDGYDPGSMDNTNPYTKALKLSNFERKKKMEELQAVITSASSILETVQGLEGISDELAARQEQKDKQEEVANFMTDLNRSVEKDEDEALPAKDPTESSDPRMVLKVSYYHNSEFDFDNWISNEEEEEIFRAFITERSPTEKFDGENKPDTIGSQIPSSTGPGNQYVRNAWAKYGEQFALDYTFEYYDFEDPLDAGDSFNFESGEDLSVPAPTGLTAEQEFQNEARKFKAKKEATEALEAAEKELAVLLEESALTKKWKDLSEEEKEEARKAARVQKDPLKAGTYGAALGNMQKLITDAYINNMMDILQIDQLLSVLERFPGSELLPRVLNATKCSTQGMFNPPLDSFLGTFALDACGDLGIGLGTPKIVNTPLANFYDRNVMTKLRNKFIQKVEEAWTDVLTQILIKVLQSIDAAICKGFNALAKATAGSMGLDKAMADTFCPDGNQDDIDNTKNNLFKAAGIVPDSINKNKMSNGETISNDSYDCLFKALNATTSRMEILGLLVETQDNMDPIVLRRIAELTNAKCPEFSSVFGTPDKVAEKFMRVANFVPVELRRALQEEIRSAPDAPVFQSICLTQLQKEEWDNRRKNLLTDKGLDEQLAEKMINDANNRVLNSLGDLSKIAEKGFDGMLGDSFDSVMDPSQPYDEPCKLKGSNSIFQNEESNKEKNDSIQSLFEVVEKRFLADLIKGRHSVLNNILRDKNNFRLTKHELRTSYPLIWANYADSEEQWQFRKDNANKMVTWQMEEDRAKGFFPETVGIRMRNALLFDDEAGGEQERHLVYNPDGQIDYKVKLDFVDNFEDKQYEFSLFNRVSSEGVPKRQMIVDETFYRKLSKKEAESLGIDPEEYGENITVSSGSTDLTYSIPFNSSSYDIDYEDDSVQYEYYVFKALLEKNLGTPVFTGGSEGLAKTCDDINTSVLNFTKNALLKDPDGGIPVGFKFGYSDGQPLTFDDLHYVNPDADPNDKKTWVYNHMPQEKVLGKSATENPRVHFLDPTIHGGSYMFPKIYIEPATYNGWLGMVRTFIPEVQKCEDLDNGFLNITAVAKRVKEVENNTKFDERL